jgi:peptidoglycan/xylan/chitin deacetylase (PgdA/CDA1 family)
LDTLERHNASASFFVLGKKIEAGQSIIRRAHDMGCEVISHSWSHCKNPNLSQLSADEIRKELCDTREMLLSVIGCCPGYFRPPYGAVSETLKEVAGELGFSIVNWSVDTWDWENRDPDIIYEKVFAGLHDYAIILCHDVYDTTANAMERVVPALLQSYELVTISELMRRSDIVPTPGVVYDNGGCQG